MRITIINGPNLNLLGKRQPEIYGHQSFESYFERLSQNFPHTELVYFQSNHEGEIIDFIQKEGFISQGIIINAGGLSHTSISIADAISSIPIPVIEVHISNISAREPFRHSSMLSPVCRGSIVGLGLPGYALAIRYLTENQN